MPARTVTFGRASADKVPTQFDIFNPGPAQWGSLPDSRGTEVRTKHLLLRSNEKPTASQLYALFTQSADTSTRTADFISLTTPGFLSAASLGREPVAALGFPAGTPARINYTASSGRKDATLTIGAPFVAQKHGDDETNSIPLLDILGPRVLLWAPTNVHLDYTLGVWQDPPNPYAPGGAMSVPGPRLDSESYEVSSRIPAGHKLYTAMLVEKGAFALRIAPRPGATDRWTTPDDIPATAGEMLVTVPRAASQADDLVDVFRQADRQPLTTVKNIPLMTDNETVRSRTMGMSMEQLYSRGDQEFEYPPTPPASGINIFGAVRSLQLSHARGDFTIGTKPLALRAKTPLELRDFNGLRDLKHRLLVPVQIDSNSARFDVQGHADTRLNGEPVATARPWIASAFAPDIVTFVCALATALSVAFARREFKSQRSA